MLDLSCADWEARLRAGRPPMRDLVLPNPAAGDRAVAVLNKLRLADVPGTPTMGEAGGEWFRAVVWALFASLDPQTKARLIRELFLLVPKKNSKTTNGALLMLTALLVNERPNAPYLLTAPVQKTADEAYSAIAGAIALDPVLDRKIHVRDHLKTMVHRESKAKLEIITFDPAVVTGKKVVGLLIDEEHVLGKMPRADKAMVQLRGGMLPFPEAFLAIITTQSDEAPTGVFRDDLLKAREIRDGKRRGRTLPVLYEFPEAMQRDRAKPWRDPANWPMVTPNAGRSVSIDLLAEACAEEEAKGEAQLRTWASQHLNVEIGVALMAGRWAGADFWEKQGDPALTLETILSRSEVVTIGIDGGGLDDLFGLAVLGRDAATQDWLAWCHAYCASIALERRKAEASTLRDFERDGDLEIVDALPSDVTAAVAVVKSVHKAGLLGGVGIDPEKGYKVVYQALIDAGIPENLILGVSQGWKLVGAITVAERRLVDGSLRHAGSRLMNYCVGNARVVPRGNAILITKEASGEGKIDPLMALLDAVDLMALNPQTRIESVYEHLARLDAAGVAAIEAETEESAV